MNKSLKDKIGLRGRPIAFCLEKGTSFWSKSKSTKMIFEESKI